MVLKLINSQIFVFSILILFSCDSDYSSNKHQSEIYCIENHLLPDSYLETDSIPFMNIYDRMQYHKVPGLSISFINNNKIAWTMTYGVRDIESNIPVTENTIFQAASLSKPIAAFMAMKAVDKYQLTLDVHIDSMLTKWQVPETKFSPGRVTLPNLLSHSAGFNLPNCPGYLEKPLPGTIQILDGTSPAINSPIVLIAEPGKSFNYSAGGYVIVQLLLEELYSTCFINLSQQLFDELKMKNSTFNSDLMNIKYFDIAFGHDESANIVDGNWAYYPEYAAAGLWTTSSDYAKFILEMQQSLQGEGTLNPTLARKMLEQNNELFGLGWMLQRQDNEEYCAYRSDGGHYGYNGIAFMYEGQDQGVVIMTNSQNGRELILEILRGISHLYKWHHFIPEKVGKPVWINCEIICDPYPDTDTLYITGDQPSLKNWNGRGIPLVRGVGNLYQGGFFVNSGITFEFKYTRGSWESEALDENMEIPDNYGMKVYCDSTISDTIKYWKDITF